VAVESAEQAVFFFEQQLLQLWCHQQMRLIEGTKLFRHSVDNSPEKAQKPNYPVIVRDSE